MTDVFRTIIVKASDAESSRSLVEDDNMFRTGLSATGSEPATHFISTGWVSEEIAELFPDATEEEPFAAMAAAELQLVQEETI